jgi:hypothetical protein
MTLPASGAITFGQVNTELGLGATTLINLNQTNVRTLFGVASGTISMSNGWGKTAGGGVGTGGTLTLTVTSAIKNFNVYSAATGAVPAGVTRTGVAYNSTCIVAVVVNSGIVIGSTATNTYAFDTGTGWASGNVLTLTNNGYISGAGGGQGQGGMSYYSGGVGSPGGGGGPAMNIQKAISITNSAGYIFGGGGGGGGGAGGTSQRGFTGGGGAGSRNYGSLTYYPTYRANLLQGGLGLHAGMGVHGYNGVGTGQPSRGGDAGGGGGPGASGGWGGGGFYQNGGAGGAKGIAISGIASVSWVSGNTRLYGTTV